MVKIIFILLIQLLRLPPSKNVRYILIYNFEIIIVRIMATKLRENIQNKKMVAELQKQNAAAAQTKKEVGNQAILPILGT